MASYPNSVPSFVTPVSGQKLNSPNHITQHVSEDGEIVAIATELGTNPKGGSASVKDRLDTVDTNIAAKADAATTTAALAAKAPIASPTFTGTVSGITATMVGLGSVTNDAQIKRAEYTAKGVLIVGTGAGVVAALGVAATDGYLLTSDAASAGGMKWAVSGGGVSWGGITGTLSNQTDLNSALAAKAPLASPTFTGTVSGITATMVGLGSVTNDAQIKRSEYTAKGVLILGTGAGVVGTVPVAATNGYLLAVNSTAASGVAWVAAPTAAVWGSITGTLSDQTDLDSALTARVAKADYTAKGVLILGTGSGVVATLGVAATNGYVLTVNSTATQGVVWAAAAGGGTPTRGTFANGNLTAGTLVVTHNLGLSSPYTMIVQCADGSGNAVFPDYTFATNSFTINVVNFGTITGTYGYAYWSA